MGEFMGVPVYKIQHYQMETAQEIYFELTLKQRRQLTSWRELYGMNEEEFRKVTQSRKLLRKFRGLESLREALKKAREGEE